MSNISSNNIHTLESMLLFALDLQIYIELTTHIFAPCVPSDTKSKSTTEYIVLEFTNKPADFGSQTQLIKF